jgi:hypothetical protein
MTMADFRLPKRLRATLAQLIRVTCPPDAERLGLVEDTIDTAELGLRAVPAHVRAALLAGVTTFELSSVARYGKGFSKLDRERASCWYTSWWHSPVQLFRTLAKSIKALVVFAYYEQPAIRKKMSFSPDSYITEVSARRLASYAEEIAAVEARVTAPDPLIPTSRLTRGMRHAG